VNDCQKSVVVTVSATFQTAVMLPSTHAHSAAVVFTSYGAVVERRTATHFVRETLVSFAPVFQL